MSQYGARVVPPDTQAITYTARGGRQADVPLTHKEGGTLAHPASAADAAALDALGYTDIPPEIPAPSTDDDAPRTRGRKDL
jgi:hypothetical protein